MLQMMRIIAYGSRRIQGKLKAIKNIFDNSQLDGSDQFFHWEQLEKLYEK